MIKLLTTPFRVRSRPLQSMPSRKRNKAKARREAKAASSHAASATSNNTERGVIGGDAAKKKGAEVQLMESILDSMTISLSRSEQTGCTHNISIDKCYESFLSRFQRDLALVLSTATINAVVSVEERNRHLLMRDNRTFLSFTRAVKNNLDEPDFRNVSLKMLMRPTSNMYGFNPSCTQKLISCFVLLGVEYLLRGHERDVEMAAMVAMSVLSLEMHEHVDELTRFGSDVSTSIMYQHNETWLKVASEYSCPSLLRGSSAVASMTSTAS